MHLRLLTLMLCYFVTNGNIYSQVDTVNVNPVDQNVDPVILSELHNEISKNKYKEVHSLLVVRNGHLVFEKYYNDFTRNELHPLYSVTKTITSALIGIAIDQGLITGTDEYLTDLFPQYNNPTYNSSRKQAVQLKHILSMTTGFANEKGIWDSNDRLEFMLNLPMDFDPGEVWKYSNGSTVLLSGIIQDIAGMSAEDFAARDLFAPLNIKNWYWNTSPDNLTGTAGGLKLRPLDMAMFGQLYLQKGIWNEQRIISEEWIDESVKVRVDHARDDRSYGYHLWQHIDSSAIAEVLENNDVFLASGWAGQKLYIIPHLNCVIVLNGHNADFKSIIKKLIGSIDTSQVLSVSNDLGTDQNSFNSFENYPNPFAHSTTIQYNLNKSDHVVLKIYNHTGQEIATLVNDFQNTGEHEVVWNSNDLPNGIYYSKLYINNHIETKKLVLYTK